MKKLFPAFFALTVLIIASCQNHSDNSVKKDSVTSSSPDSAANNGILPPSAAPGNAGNSSLADTTYKAKDSVKK
jgi:hypothetical protein